MFFQIETAVIARLEGAIPGAPVHGSFDAIDARDDGPKVQIAVRWKGFAVGEQVGNGIALQHRFEVAVYLSGHRLNIAERAAAIDGFGAVLARLVNYEWARGRKLVIAADTPEPDYADEGLAVIRTYFITPAVITATK